jgi:hypothetical protein
MRRHGSYNRTVVKENAINVHWVVTTFSSITRWVCLKCVKNVQQEDQKNANYYFNCRTNISLYRGSVWFLWGTVGIIYVEQGTRPSLDCILTIIQHFNNSTLWRIPSYGMWRHVALVRVDVSDVRVVSIIRMKGIRIFWTLAVTSNRRTLRRNTSNVVRLLLFANVVPSSPILITLMTGECRLLGCYAVWLL